MSPRFTIVYFDIRGRAEPIRLTLALAGQSFEDRGLDREQWMAMKPTAPLGQLPVLIEHTPGGETAIPQSAAILRHLGRRFGLYGETEADHLAADVAGETAIDVRAKLTDLRFSPGWKDEAARERYATTVAPVGLARLAKLLGDRPWFAGADPTWADALVYDTVDAHRATWPEVVAAFPNLVAFAERFRAIPQLADYLGRQRAA